MADRAKNHRFVMKKPNGIDRERVSLTIKSASKKACRGIYRLGLHTLRNADRVEAGAQRLAARMLDLSVCQWVRAFGMRFAGIWRYALEEPKEFGRKSLLKLLTGYRFSEIDWKVSKHSKQECGRAVAHRLCHAGVWAVAVCTVAGTAYLATNYTFGVQVLLDGQQVCMVQEQEEFTEVYDSIEAAVASTTGQAFMLDETPEYRMAFVKKGDTAQPEEVETNLLMAVSDDVMQGSALFIDGEIFGINEDESGLNQILEDIQAPYKEADPEAQVEFVQDVKIKSGLLPTDGYKTLYEIRKELSGTELEQQIYTVQENDVVSTIAEKVGSTTQQLLLLNPEIDPQVIHIGDQLVVEQAKPMLSVKVMTEIQYTEAIPYETTNIETDTLYKKTTKVKTEGQNGEKLVTAQVCKIDGVEVERTVLDTQVLMEPVTKEVLVGTKTPPATAATGSLRVPVSGYRITSRFGGYSRLRSSYHTGIDLAVPYGTAVKAADGGTVIYAGYQGSYGYLVKISHGNGVETWYAHNSKLLVSRGDKVAKGQTIAKAGSTGNSTGSHCHFEYRINGTPQNPAKYLGI